MQYINLQIPKTLEIILLEHKDFETVGQFPGLFLFTGNARMMRPVLNLCFREIELIGTFEQVYMDIAVVPEEIIQGVSLLLNIYLTNEVIHKND